METYRLTGKRSIKFSGGSVEVLNTGYSKDESTYRLEFFAVQKKLKNSEISLRGVVARSEEIAVTFNRIIGGGVRVKVEEIRDFDGEAVIRVCDINRGRFSEYITYFDRKTGVFTITGHSNMEVPLAKVLYKLHKMWANTDKNKVES